MKKERAQKRAPPDAQLLPLEDQPDLAVAAPDLESSFHRAWAREIIEETMRTMEAACRRNGRDDLWDVLQARVLRPALEGTPAPAYDELVGQFRFRSPSEASNALVTAKRMFIRCLREVIRDTVETEDEIDAEILDLKKVLADDHAGFPPPRRRKG
jgi:hypothetical protein